MQAKEKAEGLGFLGTRPNISESHSEISTRVPFCIAGAGRQASASGHYERQWITAASTLLLVLVLPHVFRRAFLCNKTTTNIRVDAAVIHYLSQ